MSDDLAAPVRRKQDIADPTVRQTFHIEDGQAIIKTTRDVTKILDSNKFLQGEQSLHHRSEVFNHVANIDVGAIQIWMAERGITGTWRDEEGNVCNWYQEFFRDPDHLKNFLNDPDNKVWRTRLGKI
jgi:hypothetical protein